MQMARCPHCQYRPGYDRFGQTCHGSGEMPDTNKAHARLAKRFASQYADSLALAELIEDADTNRDAVMSTGLKPWRFEIAWANPYTSPPDDQPRVLMSVTRVQGGGHPFPEEITRRYAEIGYGTGWCTRCSIDPDYVEKERLARSLSPVQKSKIRRRSLERRAAKHAPLFAEQIIAEALGKNPGYYAGESFVPDNIPKGRSDV
jgi:hypothetical protein